MLFPALESVVITDLADLAVELIDRVPAEADTGWDTMRDTYLVRDAAAGIDPIAAVASRLTRGTKLDGLNMWIVARSARCLARGIFRVEVVSMGLLSARGYKVRYDSAAAQQQASNVTVGGTLYASVATDESVVTADLEYVLIGSVVPSNAAFLTTKTARAHTPPAPWNAAVPASQWTSLSTFTFHFPNGWVFKAAQMENLPGLETTWLVKERYQYQYDKSPASS